MMAPQTITLPLGDARHSVVCRLYIIRVFDEMSTTGASPRLEPSGLRACPLCRRQDGALLGLAAKL